ncbi:hypothetical protein AVEN_272601-1 [Araneus ventricosus]|uniref:Uncharacterized protein n=1 Tax=Araneus ventricosus TaxID=182803 RepID=A0A4Y2GFQ2_ARAVE|nr:hypothetical protein AVEN_272601-1 [Araneus ventricosus]
MCAAIIDAVMYIHKVSKRDYVWKFFMKQQGQHHLLAIKFNEVNWTCMWIERKKKVELYDRNQQGRLAKIRSKIPSEKSDIPSLPRRESDGRRGRIRCGSNNLGFQHKKGAIMYIKKGVGNSNFKTSELSQEIKTPP